MKRFLKNMTLKYRMILGGIAAVIVPLSIAGMIIHVRLSNSLLEMAKEKSVLIVNDISSLIDSTLMQKINLTAAVASDPDTVKASKTGDYRDAQIELEELHKRVGRDFFTVFLLDRNGIVRADATFSQQIGLNLSDRDYFLRAKEGKTSVTGPLLPRGNVTPGQPIIVVSTPIQEGREFHGIVAIPFETDFLADTISQKRLGQTGSAFLVNSKGLVMVHPRKELILKMNLLDRPGMEEMAELIRGNKTGTASYSFEGSEKIAGLTSVSLTGWTVVFSQNRDEVMYPAKKILFTIFITAITSMIITIIAIILFSSKISMPIQKIMEMMNAVTKHSTEIILQMGLDRKIIFANPAFTKITGLKSEHVIGAEPDLSNTGNVPASVIWDSLETGIPWSGRVSVKGSNPDAVTLDIMLTPMRDDSGVIQGYLEIGRDVSAELMFEKRLQQSQKLEALGTLAGGIAHDFNNILSGIFGYAELALMKKKYDSETERYIGEILKASERARDLVSQILTFSRQTEVELKPLFPRTVLNEALKLLRASTPASIDIQSKIDSSSAIMAEPTQIHQVAMNFFTNAIHAMGDNAGRIKLELVDFFVDEEFTKTHPGIAQGKHILLRVSDTGKGMEPEILDHVFEPFFTTKSHGKGTGLGLSVVHGIVKKLKGIITVYSEVGKGTVFNVIIPCSEMEDSNLPQYVSSIEGGTETIAIVDDETAITTTMQAILTKHGYRVTSFTDGNEALAAIITDPNAFDLVITDYSMPGITGLEIIKKLREAGVNVPVILSSGYFSEEVEYSARDIGISEFITKPINSYQLSGAILRALKSGGTG